MLSSETLKGFIPTLDAGRSKTFYSETLGLAIVSEDDFGIEFDANGTRLRVTPVREFTPFPFTVLGWIVADVSATARELAARGVVFERYPYFEQDEDGIWTAPGGTHVAWFKDPDGNLLSLND